jgi:hypothetical protein
MIFIQVSILSLFVLSLITVCSVFLICETRRVVWLAMRFPKAFLFYLYVMRFRYENTSYGLVIMICCCVLKITWYTFKDNISFVFVR